MTLRPGVIASTDHRLEAGEGGKQSGGSPADLNPAGTMTINQQQREFGAGPRGKVTLRDWYVSAFCSDADIRFLARVQDFCTPRSFTIAEAGGNGNTTEGGMPSQSGPAVRLWRWWARYFHLWSEIISGPGIIITVSTMLYSGYERQALYLFLMLVLSLYLNDCAKDFLSCPRPPCPPLKRAGVASHAMEYGFPSAHTTCAMVLTWILSEFFDEIHPDGHIHVVEFLSFITALHIIFSRMYLGLHWLGDVLGGAVIGVFLLLCHGAFLGKAFTEAYSTWGNVPYLVPMFIGHFMLVIHAAPRDFCPCFVDSCRMVGGIVGGIVGLQCKEKWLSAVVVALREIEGFGGVVDGKQNAPVHDDASHAHRVLASREYVLHHLNTVDGAISPYSFHYWVRWVVCIVGAVLSQDIGKRILKKIIPGVLSFSAHSSPGSVSTCRRALGLAVGVLLGKKVNLANNPQSAGGSPISQQHSSGGSAEIGGGNNISSSTNEEQSPASAADENGIFSPTFKSPTTLERGAAEAAGVSFSTAANNNGEGNNSNSSPNAIVVVAEKTAAAAAVSSSLTSTSPAPKQSDSALGRLFSLKNHIHWDEAEIQAVYLSYVLLGYMMGFGMPFLYDTVVAALSHQAREDKV